MKTAREKFTEGQRVQMTDMALAQGLDGPRHRQTGTVKGFPISATLVRVLRDGEEYVRSYHVDFWEPIK